MLPRSCLRWAVSKSNSSTRLPRTTTTRVSSGWVASINILLGILGLLTAAGAVQGARPCDATVHLIRGGGEGQNARLGAAPNGDPPERCDVRSFRLASARSFRGSWSATQSGASSVGPSEHVGGKRYSR